MGKTRILIVDDMKEVYNKVKSLLGHNCDYAQNEEEALKMIKKNSYREVITDYHLGKESPTGGINVIKEAKKRGLRAILMSTENHKKEALEAGADKFIFKKRLFKSMKNGR